MQTALHIAEGCFVWCNQARFCPHLNGHVAERHSALHAQCLDGFTAEFNHVTGAACAAGFTDDGQHDVFGGNARGRFAFHFNLHGFGAALFQGLRRQNMFDFRGTNTERQGPKRAVGGRVGVTADNGHAWQGDALFWPHHVDDTLIRVVQIVELDAKFVAVFDQLLHLDTRHFTRRIDIFGLRGDVVIHCREGFTRLAHRALMRTQSVECLRGGNLVHQMAIDIQQWGFVWCLVNYVRIKQFFI